MTPIGYLRQIIPPPQEEAGLLEEYWETVNCLHFIWHDETKTVVPKNKSKEFAIKLCNGYKMIMPDSELIINKLESL